MGWAEQEAPWATANHGLELLLIQMLQTQGVLQCNCTEHTPREPNTSQGLEHAPDKTLLQQPCWRCNQAGVGTGGQHPGHVQGLMRLKAKVGNVTQLRYAELNAYLNFMMFQVTHQFNLQTCVRLCIEGARGHVTQHGVGRGRALTPAPPSRASIVFLYPEIFPELMQCTWRDFSPLSTSALPTLLTSILCLVHVFC